jgi:hypothetical protein
MPVFCSVILTFMVTPKPDFGLVDVPRFRMRLRTMAYPPQQVILLVLGLGQQEYYSNCRTTR